MNITEKRLPHWMKAEFPHGERYSEVKNLIQEHKLNTICTSGNCPNKGECWSAGTASFMILGHKCTRSCAFCAVDTMRPDPVDWNEPLGLAETIKKLQLKHCVITSVDRDDLADGGASFWAFTIRKIREINPGLTLEVLIPDFLGNKKYIQLVIDEKPEVISHNVETVYRLTPIIRSMARYQRSLDVLKFISDAGINSKSGIMLGLGETYEEVIQTMRDIRKSGVKILTIGQYLRPSPKHAEVKDYITPGQFREYKQIGMEMGYSFVESSPLVRSSYHAERHINA